MASFVYKNAKIRALTCCVPSFVQTINTDIEGRGSRYIKMFVKQTGIRSRHISLLQQTCVELGLDALKRALEHAKWEPEELDLVIFDSQTPDYSGGNCNSLFIHHYLNLKPQCACFDLTLGCSALPYAVNVASSLINQGNIRKAAILCGDSQWQSYSSADDIKKSETFLFGEGVGCILLEYAENAPLMEISLFSDGHGYKHLCHFDTGIKNSWRKSSKYILPNGEEYSSGNYMDGLEISVFAAGTVAQYIREFWQSRNTSIENYKTLILHQANAQIIKGLVKSLDIDISKVPISLDRYANTSAASSLVTMCDYYGDNGDDEYYRLCNAAFGIGLSWGICDFYIKPADVLPIFSSDLVLSEHFLKIKDKDI